jgi:N6-L-threonylcarbamoyladenine synthase
MTDERRASLAACFQRAAVGAVILKLERAAEQMSERASRPRMLVVGGGVAANSLMRRELERVAAKRGLTLKLPRSEFCMDNAAMIAGLGCELYRQGRVSDLSLQAVPTTNV